MSDATSPPSDPSRRRFLQGAGFAAGLVATQGLGWLSRTDPSGWDFERTARVLWQSLSPAQRAAVALPWDHPSRQVTVHVACLDVPRLGDVLTAEQRGLVHHLYETATSDEKRRRFGKLIGLEAGGLDPCAFLFYGSPEGGPFQVSISGGHLLMRAGGMIEGGSAFGGPLGYGHQTGNGTPRLPGNAFSYHGDAANGLVGRLPSEARARALVAGEPPHECAVQVQAAGGRFRGLPVASLDDAGKAEVASLVDVVLSCYGADDREAAWGCIRRNGGVEALHLAVWSERGFYDDGAAWSELDPAARAAHGEPYWHVWRIEGPGTVLHFRGWPHVHAAIHVAEDGGARQHVGEVIAETDRLIEDDALRPLMNAALREATDAPYGFAPEVMGRLVPGPITTGTAWSLDGFTDRLAIATVPGATVPPMLRTALEQQGATVTPDQTYRVATQWIFTGERRYFGEPEDVQTFDRPVREVYEAYFRGLTKGTFLKS